MIKYYCDLCKAEENKEDLFEMIVPLRREYSAQNSNGVALFKFVSKEIQPGLIEVCSSCKNKIADILYQCDLFC